MVPLGPLPGPSPFDKKKDHLPSWWSQRILHKFSTDCGSSTCWTRTQRDKEIHGPRWLDRETTEKREKQFGRQLVSWRSRNTNTQLRPPKNTFFITIFRPFVNKSWFSSVHWFKEKKFPVYNSACSKYLVLEQLFSFLYVFLADLWKKLVIVVFSWTTVRLCGCQ